MVNSILKSLKRETGFRLLKQKGKRVRLEPWLLMVYLVSNESDNFVGFSVSSRFLNSVKRNRIKRVFRQSLRLACRDLSGRIVHFIVTRKVSQEEWTAFNEKKATDYQYQFIKLLKSAS